MELFATLGAALGLAMLAGVNLYLTVFITGLAVKLGWIHDAALATALGGFGHPAVIAVSLGLYLVQFIADKIPWVDSLWDSIHTFIKPAGAVLLALTSLGDGAGTFAQIFVAMLAFGSSLITHGVKAGTRLTINTSPEPFSNIGASVAEDLLVIGGYMLVANRPAIAFFVFALALALSIYLTPRVSRAIRAILWLIWRKLRVPAIDKATHPHDLPTKLGAEGESLLREELGNVKYEVAWCVPCVTGKTRNAGRLCRNLFGELVALRGRDGWIYFIGSRNFKRFLEPIGLGGSLATHEAGFISEGVVVHQPLSKFHAHFRFHRGQEDLAERLTNYLQEKISRIGAPNPQGPPLATKSPHPSPGPGPGPGPEPATSGPKTGAPLPPIQPEPPGPPAEIDAAD